MAFLPPESILDGLDTAMAERRAAPDGHSIAEIVAHLAYWQDWFFDRINGTPTPMPPAAAEGWPAVAPDSWPDLRQRFLNRLEQLAGVADGTTDTRLSPPLEFPPLAHYTVADALVHVATHNSHHLGQVIMLRQLQNAWPPPSGSWTW